MKPNGEAKTEAANALRALDLEYKNIELMCSIVKLAARHTRLIETLCVKKKLSDRQKNELEEIECEIKLYCEDLGILVQFEERTNGYTVRLFAKHKLVFNTLGGSINGYGIGKPKH